MSADRGPLVPAPTRFVFGTARHSLTHAGRSRAEKVAIARHALERGLWFHIGYPGTAELLSEIFRDAMRTPPCVLKVEAISAGAARAAVDAARADFGVERFELVQLCPEPPDGSTLPEGEALAMHEAMGELRAAGTIGSHLWTLGGFTEIDRRALERGQFPGYMFSYNLINRNFREGLYRQLDHLGAPKVVFSPNANGALAGERIATDNLSRRFDPRERLSAIDDVCARSGCANRFELSIRFLLREANLAAIVGATSDPAHLDDSIRYVTDGRPLDDDSYRRVKALHEAWFAG